MKNRSTTLALLAALSATASAQSSEFDGAFVGARIGYNYSGVTGLASDWGKGGTTFGIDGGYNWDMQNFLLGVDAFADANGKATHRISVLPYTTNYGSDAYGVDFKLGLPKGKWMPYARLGYAHAQGTGDTSAMSGGELHGGLGIEYKYTPEWGVNAEWSGSALKNNGSKLNNDNLTVGIRYYFGVAKAAPAPAPEPAPVAQAPVPVPEPVVVKEVPKVEPVAVAEPAPVLAPAPVPKPKDNWKIIATEKPVRLDGANFATGSAMLLKTADARLSEVVNAAKQYPEMKLDVSGHTDSRGKKGLNLALSKNRAAAVKAWLVEHGVAANRISATGYADTMPIASNKTEAGRAANRRVEVRYAVREEKKVRVTE